MNKELISNSFEWNPHESFTALILSTAAVMSKRGKQLLKERGLEHLSYGKMGVLALLLQQPHTQAYLCVKLGQKSPSMMEMMQRLEKDQLVIGIDDPKDRRKINWQLTAKGKKEALIARDVFKRAGLNVDKFFRKYKIRKKEIDRFKEILKLLLQVYYEQYTEGEVE